MNYDDDAIWPVRLVDTIGFRSDLDRRRGLDMLSGLVHLVDVSLILQSGNGDLGDVLPPSLAFAHLSDRD